MDDPAPAGQVISQDPPAGSSELPGTVINLKVANGKVKLMDVRGLTEQQARTKLNTAGFTNINPSRVVPVEPGFKVGQVMSMDPIPGIFYNPTSTTITLTIAGLPPCPSSSPSPSASSSSSASSSPSASPSPTPSPSCTPSS